MIETDEDGCQWVAAAAPPTDSPTMVSDNTEEESEDTESPFVSG